MIEFGGAVFDLDYYSKTFSESDYDAAGALIDG